VSASPVEIQRAGVGDADAIIPLMAAFNAEEGIAWRPEPMGSALRRLLAEPNLGFVVLARDRASGAVVGYGLATFGYDLEFAGVDAFITELFVDSSLRKRGVGVALLDALVTQLRTCGAKAVHLMVRPENERARALYEGRGFGATPRVMLTKRLDAGDD